MKKIKLLMPVVGLSTIAATIPMAACNKNNKFDLSLDATSTTGVAIKDSNLKLNNDSTITLTLPEDTVIDSVTVTIDSKEAEGVTFKDNIVTIPAKAMTGYTIVLKVITKSSAGVTETEWKNAIDFLLGETEEEVYWYSNEDDVAGEQKPDDTGESGDLQYNTWSDIRYNNGDYYAKTTNYKTRLPERKEVYYEYSTLFENFNYNAYMTEDKMRVNSPQWDYYLTNKAIDSVFVFLRSIYSNYKEFTYDKETNSYMWNGEFEFGDYKFRSVATTVQFNANKKISYFLSTFEELDAAGEQVRIANMNLHFNYGKKEIEYPEWYTNRMAERINVADETGKAEVTDLSGSLGEEGQVIKFVVPSTGLTKIEVKDHTTQALVDWLVHTVVTESGAEYNPGVMVVKNGDILVGCNSTTAPATDVGYWINADETNHTPGNTITFTDPLKEGDEISVWVKPDKRSGWFNGDFTLA